MKADERTAGFEPSLVLLGKEVPHLAASSAECPESRFNRELGSPRLIVLSAIAQSPAGISVAHAFVEARGIEPPSHGPKPRVLPLDYTSSWVARESNPDHRFKRPVHHRNACNPFVPRDRVERSSPTLQDGACTTQAARAFARAPLLELRNPRASSSLTIHLSLAPSSPCRWRPAVSAVARGTVESRAKQSACSSGGRNRTLIARIRISRLTVRRPLIDLFVLCVGLERFELSPHRLKVRCAAVTPQAQDGGCGRAFELLLHHFLSWACSESNRDGAKTRDLQSRPEPCRSARPKTKRPPRISPGRLQIASAVLSQVYASGAFPL